MFLSLGQRFWVAAIETAVFADFCSNAKGDCNFKPETIEASLTVLSLLLGEQRLILLGCFCVSQAL
jgi:hypothetical protein